MRFRFTSSLAPGLRAGCALQLVCGVMFCLLLVPAWLEAAALSVEPIRALPEALNIDPAKAALGEKLFFDKRLSADNSISCAHCHDLDALGGADGLQHSFGVQGREGALNAPTVFNAALNFAQFWDGRADRLEDQVDGPVTGHAEMASSWPGVLVKLRADADYSRAFSLLYDSGITPENIKHAIAEFERTLLTPNSRFDQFLDGDVSAISAAEKKGYALFKAYGCAACHQGRNVGGNLYQKMGVMGDYFGHRSDRIKADLGRYNVTGEVADKYSFKVPSLRLVVLTAPYFHNGSEATLAASIRIMATYQLGRNIPDADIRSIIRFLYTLPGSYKGKSLEPKDKKWLNFRPARTLKTP